jgi:hypothetical protein
MNPIKPGLRNHGSSLGFEPLVFSISREQIETLDLQPALRIVQSMTVTPQVTASNAGRLSLTISGYHKGERGQRRNREILRRYFLALDRQFNGWFHVCNRWDNTLRMLFLAMTPLKEVPNPESDKPRLEFDLNALDLFISVHNLALTRLHQQNGIPARTTEHVKALMQAYFDNYFVKLKQE